ncbi:MAG: hypothetical protein NDJ89_10325 [Oligoflexia bacterium]|nr:hypothetical protein [Oligoflexia bacterium]
MGKVLELGRSVQPINWFRAFASGVVAAVLMAFFVDIFNMMGATGFSYEAYLGALFRLSEYPTRNWLFGAVANALLGGVFGLFYAYCFEYVFRRSEVAVGTRLGFAHAVVAAIGLFPFLGMIQQQMRITRFAHFGFFGSGIDAPTPILLLFGHLVFGACMGLFYGPVRAARARARFFEPGESGMPGQPGVIGEEDDPVDSAFA